MLQASVFLMFDILLLAYFALDITSFSVIGNSAAGSNLHDWK